MKTRGGELRVGRTLNTGRVSSIDYQAPEPKKTGILGRIVVAVVVVAVLVGAVMWGIAYEGSRNDSTSDGTEVTMEPTVDVVLEGGGEASSRVKLLVARLEQEAADYGLAVSRAVLPAGMQRQVDVYLEGREEYYKVLVDRSPAESMEDMARIVRYLEGAGVVPEYVDVRVAGKAYYK